MLRIAICDDQPQDIALIHQYLTKYQTIHTEHDLFIDSYLSAEELLKALRQQKEYELYFLDIIMPQRDGISLARQLRDKNITSLIVFLTASPEYSLEAFGVKAMQYLLKPVNEEDVFSVMDDACEMLGRMTARYLLVSLPEGKRQIRFSAITYVECKNRILYFHLNTGEVLKTRNIRQSFEVEMHVLLEDYRFSRPHQSYIINMNYASRLMPTEIIMQDSSIIPISKKRVKEVRKEYLDFLSDQAPEI